MSWMIQAHIQGKENLHASLWAPELLGNRNLGIRIKTIEFFVSFASTSSGIFNPTVFHSKVGTEILDGCLGSF